MNATTGRSNTAARRRQQQTGRDASVISLIDQAIEATMAGDEPRADWLDYRVYRSIMSDGQAFRWRQGGDA